MAEKSGKILAAVRAQIKAIQQELARLDLICAGSLQKRTKLCGKPNCRCARDPSARHGPYYEWSWREGRRMVHRVISKSQAHNLAWAIKNYRKAQDLLAKWELVSAQIILDLKEVDTD